MAMLFITHDLGIVRKIADRVCVMHRARSSRQGTVEQVFRRRSTPTPARCSPPNRRAAAGAEADGADRGEADDLKVWFPIKRGFLRRTVGHIKAVDGVIDRGARARRSASSANPAPARPRSASRSCG